MDNNSAALIQNSGNYRMAVLDAWLASKQQFLAAQQRERELRAKVIELFSEKANDAMASGVENIDTGVGKIKITHKLEYKLEGSNAKVDAMLDKIEKSQEGGNVIAERLVNWKPELSVREYKLLSKPQQLIVDEILVIKPASKSVELDTK